MCVCVFFFVFFCLGGRGGAHVCVCVWGGGVVGYMAVPTRDYCSCRQMEVSA